MDTIFTRGTQDLITDGAINALDNSRAAGMPDWDAREAYLQACGLAFDAAADDQEDADPDQQRPEFLG